MLGGDYRDILRQALVERCNRNPRYSLRAFARDLRLDPARLCDVLNGKKGLSRQAATAIAKALGKNERETEIFCDLVEAVHARSQAARKLAQQRVQERQQAAGAQNLTVDAFKTVSDWYHFALLQLLKLPKCEQDFDWMAKALGIQRIQVEDAMARMERLELIENKEGRYEVTREYVVSPDGIPSEAIRKFHEQVLQKATSAIYTQPVAERDFSAMTFPLARKDLPKARKRIRDFMVQLSEELTHSSDVDSVYCFAVQLFGLTTGAATQEKGNE